MNKQERRTPAEERRVLVALWMGCDFGRDALGGIRAALDGDMTNIPAYVLGETVKPLTLAIAPLTDEEKEIIRCGSLINYNRNKKNA